MIPSIISDQVNEDLETALSVLQSYGYENVELHNVFGKSIEECSLQEAEQIAKLIKKYKMKVSSIASTIFFLCPLYPDDKPSLFNPDFYCLKGNIENHLEALKRCVSIAEILNCENIRVFPFRFPDNREGPYGTKEDMDRIVTALQRAVQIVEGKNIRLILENCPYSHCPKGQMTLKIIQTINHPQLKLLWDPANSYRAVRSNVPEEYLNWDLYDELENLYPYIGHIHLKNYHYDSSQIKPFVHTSLLTGDINFEEILKRLKNKGYTKALSLEPEVDKLGTLESMEALQKCLNR